MSTRFCILAYAGLLAGLLYCSSSSASIVLGGSDLLTQQYADQLETWLGEGPIVLTRVFNKQPGNTSFDFHAAVDGLGRTFTVIEVLENSAYDATTGDPTNNPAQIIGGYNPQSWSSIGNYNYTYNIADRTAFLFNLTTTEIQHQNLNSTGVFQTYNLDSFGPAFGGGFDIYVTEDLRQGYVFNYSYGGTTYSKNILGGSSIYQFGDMFGAIEVFTIAAAPTSAVPEATSLLVWGGLASVFASSRKLFGRSRWRRDPGANRRHHEAR